MKKKISPKSIFVFIQCIIMCIAPFFDYWTVFARAYTIPKSMFNYYEQYEKRFGLFGKSDKSLSLIKANFDPSDTTDRAKYEMFIDRLGDINGYVGKYSYIEAIRFVCSVIVAILTVLALIRIVLYVMEFLNFRFIGRFTYPKILEKCICIPMMILTALLIILVVFMELKSEIKYVKLSDKDYGFTCYLYAGIGFYLTIVPGIFIGALGKEPKQKKEE